MVAVHREHFLFCLCAGLNFTAILSLSRSLLEFSLGSLDVRRLDPAHVVVAEDADGLVDALDLAFGRDSLEPVELEFVELDIC